MAGNHGITKPPHWFVFPFVATPRPLLSCPTYQRLLAMFSVPFIIPKVIVGWLPVGAQGGARNDGEPSTISRYRNPVVCEVFALPQTQLPPPVLVTVRLPLLRVYAVLK